MDPCFKQYHHNIDNIKKFLVDWKMDIEYLASIREIIEEKLI